MKKSLSVLLIMAMLASLLAAALPVFARDGDNQAVMDTPWTTESGWTEISNASDFSRIQNSKKYYLTADISVAQMANIVPTNVTIHGNGKTITLTGNQPIFSNAKNLTVRWLNLAGDVVCDNSSATTFCSPFGRYNNDVGTIIFENVNSAVNIKYSRSTNRYQSVSGVFHTAENGSRFENVTYSGDMVFEGSYFLDFIGAIVGAATGTTFKNVNNTGTITFKTKACTLMYNGTTPTYETTYIYSFDCTNASCDYKGEVSTYSKKKDDDNTYICPECSAEIAKTAVESGKYKSKLVEKQYENDDFMEIGGIAAKAYGCSFEDCTNKMDISYLGGLRGQKSAITYTCDKEGNKTSEGTESKIDTAVSRFGTANKVASFVGGFVGLSGAIHGGESKTEDKPTTFKNCTNEGDITLKAKDGTVSDAGGFVGLHYAKTLVFDDCENKGDIVNTVDSAWWLGGFVARYMAHSSGSETPFKLEMTDCQNKGDITSYNTGANNGSYNGQGGLVGYLYGRYNSKLTASLKNCKNYGNMLSDEKGLAYSSLYGGIVGQVVGWPNFTFESCVNYGDVKKPPEVKSEGYGIGGIVGGARCYGDNWVGNTKATDLKFINCVNLGDVDGKNAAGIFGSSNVESNTNDKAPIAGLKLSFEGCTNIGNINDPRGTIAAGIMGDAGNFTINIADCANGGAISSKGKVAGIIANTAGSAVVSVADSVNYGTIGLKDENTGAGVSASAGGIAGSTSVATLSGSINLGKIYGLTSDAISASGLSSESTGNKYLKGSAASDKGTEVAALADIIAAVDALGLRACNYNAMFDLIDMYLNADPADYLYEKAGATWDDFKAALNAIKGDIDSEMGDVFGFTQAEANVIYLELMEVISDARLKPDFTFIKTEITRGENKLKDGNTYADSSVSKLTAAIEAAKALVEKGNASTVEDVEEAVKALTRAIDTMRRINSEDDEGNNGGETPPPTDDGGDTPPADDGGETPPPADDDGEGEPPAESPSATTTEPKKDEGGCGGVIGGAVVAVVAILGTGVCFNKKRD